MHSSKRWEIRTDETGQKIAEIMKKLPTYAPNSLIELIQERLKLKANKTEQLKEIFKAIKIQGKRDLKHMKNVSTDEIRSTRKVSIL